MSFAWIMWGCLGLLYTVVVAAIAIAWGKAHPTIQSTIAEGVGKVEKKLGM
jgi:hypothetical protein